MDTKSKPAAMVVVTPPTEAGKRFNLIDGELVSEGVPVLGSGTFETFYAGSIDELVLLLDFVTPGQVVLWCELPVEKGELAPQDSERVDEEVYSRTGGNCSQSAERLGVVALDLDQSNRDKNAPAPSRAEYVEMLRGYGVTADIAIRGSTSSLLYEKRSGRQLKGANGLRAYFLVAPATSVPDVLDRLFDRA